MLLNIGTPLGVCFDPEQKILNRVTYALARKGQLSTPEIEGIVLCTGPSVSTACFNLRLSGHVRISNVPGSRTNLYIWKGNHYSEHTEPVKGEYVAPYMVGEFAEQAKSGNTVQLIFELIRAAGSPIIVPEITGATLLSDYVVRRAIQELIRKRLIRKIDNGRRIDPCTFTPTYVPR
ncbi:MAG: hypothetical protein ACOCXQ_04945 [Patescibacteria group bacterium]